MNLEKRQDERAAWLASLRVGAKVGRRGHAAYSVYEIVRETPTQWVLSSGKRLRKADGTAVGYSGVPFVPVDTGFVSRMRELERERRREEQRAIVMRRLQSLSTRQLQALWEIHKATRPRKSVV